MDKHVGVNGGKIKYEINDDIYKKITSIHVKMNNEIDDYIVSTVKAYADAYDHREIHVNAKKILDAVKAAEKYKWHDRRKNPYDLPEDGMLVAIMLKTNEILPDKIPICGIYDKENHRVVYNEDENLFFSGERMVAWRRMNTMWSE